MSDTPDDIVISLKPHGGFDSPLIVFRARDEVDAADRIRAAEAAGLFAIVGNAQAALVAQFNAGAYAGGTPVDHPATTQRGGQSQPPAQGGNQRSGGYQGRQGGNGQGRGNGNAPTPPPGMTAPQCPHGTKVYRKGESSRGPWQGWFCPAPKGDPSQCKADFFK